MKKTFDVKRLTTLALLTTIALTIFVVNQRYLRLFQYQELN